LIKILVIFLACVGLGYMVYSQNILGVQTLIQPVTADITNQITQNPLAIATGAIPAIGTVGTIAWKAVSSIKNRAKDEVNQIAVNANSQVQQATSQAAQLEKEKQKLKDEISKLQQENPDLTTLKNKVFESEESIKSLRGQNQGLQDMHTNFIKSLTSGKDTVIDPATNEIYKVIKITETKVL